MTDAAMAAPTRRADMWFAGTAPQRRLTVAFRVILAIPQIVVLYFLFIATFFVLVIGWFGALFMGRLPEWVHSFVERRRALDDTGVRVHVPPDRPVPPVLARRRGLPGPADPPRTGPAQPLGRAVPHHPGHPGGRLRSDRRVRPHLPAALRRLADRTVQRTDAPGALPRVLGAAALPGTPALLLLHAHLGVRLGHAGRPTRRALAVRPAPPPPPFPTPQAPGPTAIRHAALHDRLRPPAGAAVRLPFGVDRVDRRRGTSTGRPRRPSSLRPTNRARWSPSTRPVPLLRRSGHHHRHHPHPHHRRRHHAPHRPRRDAPAVPVGALGAVGADRRTRRRPGQPWS